MLMHKKHNVFPCVITTYNSSQRYSPERCWMFDNFEVFGDREFLLLDSRVSLVRVPIQPRPHGDAVRASSPPAGERTVNVTVDGAGGVGG